MSKTRSNQGVEGKWEYLSNVSKPILNQFLDGSLGYWVNGPIGVSLPMSKTRSKQVIEDKWGDLTNLSNTIVKQVIEAEVSDIAPMFQ